MLSKLNQNVSPYERNVNLNNEALKMAQIYLGKNNQPKCEFDVKVGFPLLNH